MVLLKFIFTFVIILFLLGALSLFLFVRSFIKMKKQFDNLGTKDESYEEIRTTHHAKNKQIFDDNEGEYVDFEEEKVE